MTRSKKSSCEGKTRRMSKNLLKKGEKGREQEDRGKKKEEGRKKGKARKRSKKSNYGRKS